MTSCEYPVALLPPDCGDVFAYLFAELQTMAPYPNQVYGAAGAIGFLSGICGRGWNINGAGLNQYILVVGETGTGKDAIASGTSKIFAAVQRLTPQVEKATVPGISDFRGPGELVSSAGLLKWIDAKPCSYSILGEVGLLMKLLASPKAPANYQGLMRVLLQLWSKSGSGNTVDPSAYSDPTKNTGLIGSPSLTILGETTGSALYKNLNEELVASGFLPRCLLIESTAPRPYENRNRPEEPSPQCVRAVADLTAMALSLGRSGGVQRVELDAPAERLLDQFGAYATDNINAGIKAGEEVTCQLWNRAHLKALKLTGIAAVSRNMVAPVAVQSDAQWACDLINHQTTHLIDKFARDEVGNQDGNEVKQTSELRRVIREYIMASPGKYESSGCTYDMHRDHIFSQGYLSRRLIKLPTFANDRAGGTNALKRCIRELSDNDEIRRVNTSDMIKRYQTAAASFGLANENLFMAGSQ